MNTHSTCGFKQTCIDSDQFIAISSGIKQSAIGKSKPIEKVTGDCIPAGDVLFMIHIRKVTHLSTKSSPCRIAYALH